MIGMSDVLIRDVPADDLAAMRAAAAQQGTSLQSYLRQAVHAQAVHLRRQAALSQGAERLNDQPAVPDAERTAVLEAIDQVHADRADRLRGRREP